MMESPPCEPPSDTSVRKQLRSQPDLDTPQADFLVQFEDDFRVTRRDHTLANVVEHASLDALVKHSDAIASGPAAAALWRRFAHDPQRCCELATALISGRNERAAATTLALLVGDPHDPFTLGTAIRIDLAETALRSQFADVRGSAAEFLSATKPDRILGQLDTLLLDSDARSRSVAWRVAFRHQPADARARSFAILADEHCDLSVRRSALLAAGAQLPTDELVALLSWFVAHPDPQLAGDAVALLHDYHRNPLVAEAALHSPHAHVRAVAEQLLDPLRGSPAAGGNRPGSPIDTHAIFDALIRREARE